MRSKKLILAMLLSTVVASQGLYEFRAFTAFRQTERKTESVQFVDYCDLVRASEKYSGQKVQTRAIVVAVVAPTAHGPTVLYSPDCDGKNNRVIVADHQTLLIPKKESRKLDRAFENQKTERKFARVEIKVTGKFKFPMNTTIYKHLPSLEIISVEEIKQVKDDVPWPLL